VCQQAAAALHELAEGATALLMPVFQDQYAPAREKRRASRGQLMISNSA